MTRARGHEDRPRTTGPVLSRIGYGGGWAIDTERAWAGSLPSRSQEAPLTAESATSRRSQPAEAPDGRGSRERTEDPKPINRAFRA